MRVSRALSESLSGTFQNEVAEFLCEQKWIEEPGQIESVRFLNRSVVPHVRRLSELFNRQDTAEAPTREQWAQGLDPYWSEGSNPKNRRYSYFLSFMPANLFRMAAVMEGLSRLGYRWPFSGSLKAVEWGAGPASGACGIALAQKVSDLGLPSEGSFALMDQDRSMLEIGGAWAERFFSWAGMHWTPQTFHRKLSFQESMLPPKAPRFQLWTSSFFYNEAQESELDLLAEKLTLDWNRHLEEEGLIVLVEPALKHQSRKLLTLRKKLLEHWAKHPPRIPYQILGPCLGSQACDALKTPEDWCHDEAAWWRPGYFKKLDDLAGLDRKALAMSYLVITKSKRSLPEILPALQSGKSAHRLVSEAKKIDSDFEVFVCGPEGKTRGRIKKSLLERPERGDVWLDLEARGDSLHRRFEKISRSV